jgi:hypothetical protein
LFVTPIDGAALKILLLRQIFETKYAAIGRMHPRSPPRSYIFVMPAGAPPEPAPMTIVSWEPWMGFLSLFIVTLLYSNVQLDGYLRAADTFTSDIRVDASRRATGACADDDCFLRTYWGMVWLLIAIHGHSPLLDKTLWLLLLWRDTRMSAALISCSLPCRG